MNYDIDRLSKEKLNYNYDEGSEPSVDLCTDELKYYRDIVDKMHTEMNYLNSKLTDLEKSNRSNRITNYSLSDNLNNFYGEKNEVISVIDTMNHRNFNFSDVNMKSSIGDKTLKDECLLVGLDNKNTNSNIESRKSKNSSTIKASTSNISTRSKSKTKEVSKIVEKLPLKNKLQAKSVDKYEKKKLERITKAGLDKQNTLSNSNSHKNTNTNKTKTKNESNNLKQENEKLKNQIKLLESQLSTKTKFDTLESKGKDHLRLELEIWKNRCDSLSNNFTSSFQNLKKEINRDKSDFIEKLHSLQSEYTYEILSVKTKYQKTIEAQERAMRRLKKENEDLNSKLSKVKNIII